MFSSLLGKRTSGDGVNTLADGSRLTLALYEYETCPYCRRVFRAIDRLHANVEYRDVSADRAHAAALYRATGRHTVPCLFYRRGDGPEQILFESEDIVDFLEHELRGAA